MIKKTPTIKMKLTVFVKKEVEINVQHGTDDITDKDIKKINVKKDSQDDTTEFQNKIGECDTSVIETENPDRDKIEKEAENQNKTEINECSKTLRDEPQENITVNTTESLNLIENIEVRETAREKDNIESAAKDNLNKKQSSLINTKIPHSSWETYHDSCPVHEMRLKLRKITETRKQQVFDSDDYSLAEDVDDSDADPDFDGTSDSSISDNSLYEERVTTETEHEGGKHITAEDRVPEGEVKEVVSNEMLENQGMQKKGKKRKANPKEWKKNKAKILRNSGKAYLSSAKVPKEKKTRGIQQPCGDRCKLKCSNKINQEMRQSIFNQYWDLGNLQLQREYISKNINPVQPQYRYQREGSHRGLNHAFYFTISGKVIRVCKTFFKATLDITDRLIRTVIKKCTDGFVAADQRGKHGNHKVLKPQLGASIREHINSIPKIESHYLRAQTTREYIEGGKTIAELHRDYMKQCNQNNVPYGNLTQYSRIFNNEFNISFFSPKKDQCELCVAYKNAEEVEKCALKEKYNTHLKEKELSREEKKRDKELAAGNEHLILATYDLQAVLPAPRGEVSVFYYKSKINSYNFTVNGIELKNVACYFWHEGEANRGANEIATCVMKYIEQTAEVQNDENLEMVFFSDNCCGQQKNKFILSMYLYAVQKFNLKSITHKFLIKGHTQNEGDNIHAVIEKAIKQALKSGPIYHPIEYTRIIRSAKETGVPYKVIEMTHSDFINLKYLAQDLGPNFNKTTENEIIKFGEIKVVKVLKEERGVIYIKTSYEQQTYKKIDVLGKRKHPVNFNILNCIPAY